METGSFLWREENESKFCLLLSLVMWTGSCFGHGVCVTYLSHGNTYLCHGLTTVFVLLCFSEPQLRSLLAAKIMASVSWKGGR